MPLTYISQIHLDMVLPTVIHQGDLAGAIQHNTIHRHARHKPCLCLPKTHITSIVLISSRILGSVGRRPPRWQRDLQVQWRKPLRHKGFCRQPGYRRKN
jgi:hypothetical protein